MSVRRIGCRAYSLARARRTSFFTITSVLLGAWVSLASLAEEALSAGSSSSSSWYSSNRRRRRDAGSGAAAEDEASSLADSSSGSGSGSGSYMSLISALLLHRNISVLI